MVETLPLIDQRSAAFRAAIAAAPDLDAPVPSCPGWTLFELAQHLGQGQRRWAGIIAAGPAAEPPAEGAPEPAPREREELAGWLAAATRQLLHAVQVAGPDRGCWTWWDGSESPLTAGAVARHQLQEVAVHTYDAELALGAPRPLPGAVALDGVDEFLATCCAGAYRWPYEPATIDYHAAEGPSWRLSLAAGGVRLTRFPGAAPDAADASVRGTAGELVLALYNRITVDALEVGGDRRLFDLLLEWDPDE
ncbi:maleylpyruvate isomerase family mycothiol-dependent enzyme [Dactylosporangium sp. NPDC049140]|uniref:maleylpyruvate isomerase family mycothiol-dependent enzyme n=1 Tax=Dactylosporangium sp. NPDC049140 TaxID=3155647 RepID=UPI0033D26161